MLFRNTLCKANISEVYLKLKLLYDECAMCTPSSIEVNDVTIESSEERMGGQN